MYDDCDNDLIHETLIELMNSYNNLYVDISSALPGDVLVDRSSSFNHVVMIVAAVNRLVNGWLTTGFAVMR